MQITVKELRSMIHGKADDTPVLVTFWNTADSRKSNGNTPIIGGGVFSTKEGDKLFLNVLETDRPDEWVDIRPVSDLPRKA